MYCKNNPVNMSDSSGVRPDFGDGTGRETEEERELSFSTMSQVNHRNYQHRNNPVHKIMDPIANATGSQTGGAIASSLDSTIAYSVAKRFDKWLFKPATFSRALDCGLGGIYAASKFTKVAGVLGITATGIGIWDNFAHYENGWGRTAVDLGVFAVGIGLGIGLGVIEVPVITAGAVGVLAGGALTLGGNAIKDKIFSRRKL